MAYTYVDISLVKNKDVYSQGYDNTNDVWTEQALIDVFDFYLLAADNKYSQIYREKEIAEADVKTFASGKMTETAKNMLMNYAYCRYYSDNPLTLDEVNQEEKFCNLFMDAYNSIDVSDITNETPSEEDSLDYWADRE